MPQGYNIRGHGGLINDSVRTKAYRRAIQATVKPGSVVVDIGTGVGIMAFFAAQQGARHVYAIEHDDSILVARELARVNGLTEKITFFQDFSTAVSLPEKADVVISEIHGSLPLYQGLVPTIIDARERFLKPGGMLLPQKEKIWANLVGGREAYKRHLGAFLEHDSSFDFSPARHLAVNSISSDRIKSEELVNEPRLWATLDYRSISETDFSNSVEWTSDREATLYGVVMWFDSELIGDIGFSNAAGQPEVVFGRTFFPFLRPLDVTPEDKITVEFQANLIGSSYTWTWKTAVRSRDQGRTQNFKQSTFFGKTFSPGVLRRQAASHVPHLNEAGRLHRFILASMEKDYSLQAIAERLPDEFPKSFKDWQSALKYLGPFSIKYGK